MQSHEKSNEINELAKALVEVQKEIKPALKDSANPFFKSKYADLNAVWNSCREALGRNGLAVSQTLDMRDNGLCGLTTTLMHISGQWISGTQVLNPVKNDPQGVGSATTYARRYGLAAIIGIVADEDDDGNSASGKDMATKVPIVVGSVATKVSTPYKRTQAGSNNDPLAGTGLS
jgi:hypothetical protein